ncbi:membrane protein, partial [Rhodococcus rhodochrous]
REQARPALASVACMVALVVGLAGLGITATLLHAA